MAGMPPGSQPRHPPPAFASVARWISWLQAEPQATASLPGRCRRARSTKGTTLPKVMEALWFWLWRGG